MQIELGKTYVTANGAILTAAREYSGVPNWCWMVDSKGRDVCSTYMPTGKYYESDTPHGLDVVAAYAPQVEGVQVVAAEPAPAQAGQAGGLKFDAGKLQWHLLLSGKGMIRALEGVVTILMFGAKKYAAHSWREVENNEQRYLDGLMRHYAAIMRDGIHARDEESGELHIDHLNCNGLFLGEIARAK